MQNNKHIDEKISLNSDTSVLKISVCIDVSNMVNDGYAVINY